jgi:hypothetical protein
VATANARLARAIRHAEANDKVRRNVATLVDTPAGQEGRPSKSLTFEQAVALIRAARSYGLYAYVVLSLLVGIRTEEARALRWDHVDLAGDPDADPPVPPHIDVWRSVRAHGDTKTKKSRRSLGTAQDFRPGRICGEVGAFGVGVDLFSCQEPGDRDSGVVRSAPGGGEGILSLWCGDRRVPARRDAVLLSDLVLDLDVQARMGVAVA